MDDALYREEILDHYRSSPYRGALEAPDHSADLDNPLCGDQIHLELKVDDEGRIAAIRFDGHGCALSQAGASMLAEHIEGSSLREARAFTSESMLDLLGVKLTPTRIKCWILGWRALQAAIPAEIQGTATDATLSTSE
jgi:nitrogen fixation NifU-like protein